VVFSDLARQAKEHGLADEVALEGLRDGWPTVWCPPAASRPLRRRPLSWCPRPISPASA